MRTRFTIRAGIVGLALLGAGCEGRLPTAPDTPIIRQFSAEPLTIRVGQTAILRWDVDSGNVRIDPGIGDGLPRSGSIPQSPTVTTVYTLTAWRPGDPPVQRIVTLTVTP